jgi:hypothetical protein
MPFDPKIDIIKTISLDAMGDCISECMATGKSQEQAIAICYSKLGGEKLADPNIPVAPIQPTVPGTEPAKTKNKLELLADFKKQIEKNGYKIPDQILENLIEAIQSGVSETFKKFSFKASVKLDKNQWIQVFPRGTYYFEKYDNYFTFDDKFFSDIEMAFQSEKLFKPYMDINHNLEEKVAEIIALKTTDQGLFANIQLNPNGIELIKNNVYSYISPEWGDKVDTDKVLHKNCLWAVTLTNIPAFEGILQKVQDQIKLSHQGGNMTLKERTIKLEGRITAATDPNAAPAIDPQALIEAVTMLKEAIAKIDELTGQVTQQENQIVGMKKEKEEKETELYFSEQIKSGKIDVSEVEELKGLYVLDKSKVTSLIAKRKEKNDFQLTGSATVSGNKLTTEDYTIMENLGFNKDKPDDVMLYIKSQK